MNRTLKGILEFLGGVLVLVVMFFICVNILKNEGKSFEKKRVPLEQERQAAIEEAQKLDPEEHKTVLTQQFLKADYRLFYEARQSTGNAFMKFTIVFIIGTGILVIGSTVIRALRDRREGNQLNILRIVACIIPIIVGIVFFFAIRSMSSRANGPNPDKAEYKVYTVNILRKKSEVKTSTDSDGNTRETTDYYIYYEGADNTEVKLSVARSLYDVVTDPGMYYMSMADDGSKKIYFAIYTLDQYKKAE